MSLARPASEASLGDLLDWSEDFSQQVDSEVRKVVQRVEIESPPVASSSTETVEDQKPAGSLLARFRRFDRLSVTDLVGPDWCEQQHTYGLHSKRNKGTARQLPSFVSDAGKTITVNKQQTFRREKILKGGHAVHSVLEQEIMPETVKIDAITPVDRQALKLMNILVGLQQLYAEGKVRELPIFGNIEGVQIRGVIDEIERRPLEKKRKGKGSEPASPDRIDFYFTKEPKARKKQTLPTHGYFLVDNKTRGSSTLPNEESMTGPRHQIELYKMLFDVHVWGAYNWSKHFADRDLAVDEVFSLTFRQELKSIAQANGIDIGGRLQTLADVVDELQSAFLRIGVLQPRVALVFRNRGSTPPPSPPPFTEDVDSISPIREDDVDLQRAIALSLEPPSLLETTTPPATQTKATPSYTPKRRGERSVSPETGDLVEEALVLDDTTLGIEEEQANGHAPDLVGSLAGAFASAPSGTVAARSHASAPAPAADSGPTGKAPAGSIIGTRNFTYNEVALLDWLRGRMAYWRSEREPIGIPEHQTWKCRSCEFNEGCEWLEKKQEEATKRFRRLQQQRQMQSKKRAPPA